MWSLLLKLPAYYDIHGLSLLGNIFTTTYPLNNNILLESLYKKYIKSPHGKKLFVLEVF